MSKLFIPNVNGVKLKSKRRRPKTQVLKQKIVKPCKHIKRLNKDSGEIGCEKCGEICDTWFIPPKQDKTNESNTVIWNRAYDKSRWTTYSLEMMSGRCNDCLPDQLWLELCREVPDPFRWYDVYKVFQRYKLLKYWIAFGSFIGYKVKLNRTIIDYFNDHMEMKYGKYCVSYMYLLYKFTQMFGEPGSEQFIPLKYSASWYRKTDGWWEIMCLENNWEYYPTKIHKIKWNKQEFLRKFAYCVKEYYINTQKHLHVENTSCFIRP